MADTALSPDDTAQPVGADLPWWKGAVIYQIYPRSFQDTNDDGIGDLRGIHDRLDYVESLGVDGIWISPFFTSPMADYGYDVADFCDVDPIFGTLKDFDALVEKAHGLGLKVIIDQVYSHTSDQHDWFTESRSSKTHAKSDWYVWAAPKPDGSPPNNWQSVFGGSSWEWDARRGQYYLHNFLKQQPDLNLHNPEVQDALIAVARFWLDRGVDGFRLDALNFGMHDQKLRDNPPSGITADQASRPFDMQKHQFNMSQPEIVGFIERIRAVMDEYPGSFTVAEIGGPDPLEEMKAFTQGEGRLNSAYSFDFLYAPDLTKEGVRSSLTQWTDDPNEGWPSWAFSNHDAPRAVSRWAPPEARDRMARVYMMLLMALRGNPILYQGEELGLPQADVPFEQLKDPEAIANWPKTLGRDGARTPMPWATTRNNDFAGFSHSPPWLPVDPRHQDLAVETQLNSESMLTFTKAALAARNNSSALKWGNIIFLDGLPEGIIGFERRAKEERITILINMSDTAHVLSASMAQIGPILLESGPGSLSSDYGELAPLSAVWIAHT